MAAPTFEMSNPNPLTSCLHAATKDAATPKAIPNIVSGVIKLSGSPSATIASLLLGSLWLIWGGWFRLFRQFGLERSILVRQGLGLRAQGGDRVIGLREQLAVDADARVLR